MTIVLLPVLAAAYSHVGISLAQRWAGSDFLVPTVIGTTAYETAFVYVPLIVVTGAFASTMGIAIAMSWTGRWPTSWAWICPACAIAWVLFLAAVLPRWEYVSP